MPGGVIISDSEPSLDNRYAWFKPSTRTWYKLNDGGTAWIVDYEESGDGLATETFDSSTHTLRKLKVINGLVTEFEIEAL